MDWWIKLPFHFCLLKKGGLNDREGNVKKSFTVDG